MQEFIAFSPLSKEIKNSADLLKTLDIHALILGESGVGKKTLAFYIANDFELYQARQLQNDIADNVINIQSKTLIVENIEQITNTDLFVNFIHNNQIRIIATSNKTELPPSLAELFSITLHIPALDQRKEDIKPLAKKFSKEASKVLGMDKAPEKLIINTSNNAHSLRKSIYFSYLFESIGENEIMMLLENYMTQNMQGENSYRDLLYLFEAPLLKSSQKKYTSQVQMAKHLGLNRITLRKKIDQHKELL
jgi:DNA-binding NtrC family response regulator